MKSRLTIFTEASCYVMITSGAPFVELLISDRELTNRSLTAAAIMALVAGANALKAYLSQSMQHQKPMEVVAPPGEPLEVTETKPEK